MNQTLALSKFENIYWSTRHNKWRVIIWDRNEKKKKAVGYFEDTRDAVKARNKALKKAGYSKSEIDQKVGSPRGRNHKGVYWNNSHKRWQVNRTVKGKQRHVGFYKSYEAACDAAERAIWNSRKKQFILS
jgi:hypothetical protein